MYFLPALLILCLLVVGSAGAASVGAGTGYTNDFSARPAASDWSTRSFGSGGQTGAGEITSVTALDTAVQTNTASMITAQVGTSTANPPNSASTATHSSSGMYLQARPTSTAVTLLMATLQNNTGTNATSIRIVYDYTTNRAASVTEEVRGLRVYYSLTGTANSWSNIAALSGTAQGTLSVNLTLSGTWGIGSNLFLLWADDNGSGTPDDANDIDNFFVTVTGGLPPGISCDLTAPLDGLVFPDTNTIGFAASANPGPGGALTGVGFYDVSRGLLGSATVAPYAVSIGLSAGVYQVYAVASNNLLAVAHSRTNTIVVTNVPFSAALLGPTNGQSFGTPTNITLVASAYGGSNATITGVGFYDAAFGFVGSVLAPPFHLPVFLEGGTYGLYVVATNSTESVVRSATNTVVVTIPPTNTLAPTVFSQVPPHSNPLTNLTSITVIFSEPVTGVTAGDLLVNGVPATGVTGTGSNYTFTFPRPAYGEVSVTWSGDHGITDFGWPTALPFDGTGLTAQWGYYLFDQTPPVLFSRVPSSGSTATNLEQITVVFSEEVNGVDEGDLLVNGSPANHVTGSGSNYTFGVTQPSTNGPVTISVSWAGNHGITDLASSPNAFVSSNAGWSFTLDARTPLIQSNSVWRFIKGLAEASNPTNAWRFLSFDASGWSNAPAPFFYGDPYSNGVPAFTLLSDMQSNYSTIYLRQEFLVADRSAISNLFLAVQIDDGFVAWLNGVEVRRVNAPAGEVAYSGVATTQSTEPQNTGAAYVSYFLTNAASLLVDGTNLLAVHALNQSLTSSSDFGFNAQLYTYLPDMSRVSPRVAQVSPVQGEVLSLSNVTVTFTEGVSGVEAADLLVNGVPASTMESSNSSIYTFGFPQPAYGTVTLEWAPGHGISDFDSPPKELNAGAAANTLRYTLVDTEAPVVAGQTPTAGSTVSNLSEVLVVFSQSVTGVNAGNLLMNGVPATSSSGSGTSYAFSFDLPPYGLVALTWATNSDIRSVAQPPGVFDGTRTLNVWNYTLEDREPPSVASQDPPDGTAVLDLTQVTVTFTEPVVGVDAADLLINGSPATSVSGGSSTYTFGFPAPNADTIDVTWAPSHGIRDAATTPNAFTGTGPDDTWHYITFDTVAPSISVYPPPSVTVRRLTQITVSFNEPVTGVNAGDLLINSIPAQQVSGSGAGPYVFTFSRPSTGLVQVAFAPGHGIEDTAFPPNSFAGAAWNYVLDPSLPIDVAVSHVVQMSLDGLASRYLAFYLTNAPAQFPNFARLTTEAAYTLNARCDYDISETIPNHATMFTGRPVLRPSDQPNTVHHGYNNNFPAAADTLHNSGNTNVPYKASMFDVAHDYGRSTAFYAGKTRLGICDRSFNEVNGAVDLVGEDDGRDKIDYSSVLDISGASISNEINGVVADLSGATPKQYTFIHIAEPDITGHASSWGSANWSNAVRMVDAQVGRVLNAIDANPVLANQTAVLITADHGGGGVTANAHTEAYHRDNYTIPFFLRAPGITAGSDVYELFTNRGNPGTNRTDYTTQPQPIRNGDASNIALSLLGLPPIPGSFMVPAFTTLQATLGVARLGGLTTVYWYDPADRFALESTDALSASQQWQTITNGIVLQESTKVYTITNGIGSPERFFRVVEK